jgi:hypothetical protein
MVGALVADRTQEQPREPASAPGAHHQQIGAVGPLQEATGGRPLGNKAPHRHPRRVDRLTGPVQLGLCLAHELIPGERRWGHHAGEAPAAVPMHGSAGNGGSTVRESSVA